MKFRPKTLGGKLRFVMGHSKTDNLYKPTLINPPL
jgi:hypothetical protein